MQVSATPTPLRLIEEIVREHGPVLFHQSGGCCDGSSPMCYPRGEFIIGDTDVLLGHISGAPVYISGSQFEVWKHTDLVIDVVPRRGGMFSLDNGREVRFLTRSRICSPDRAARDAWGKGTGIGHAPKITVEPFRSFYRELIAEGEFR